MSDNDTTRAMPIVYDGPMAPLIAALNAVVSELKTLSRKVDNVDTTLNGHVTKIALLQRDYDSAVARIQNSEQTQVRLIESLAARILSLEKERDDLTRSVLAKAITLVLLLGAAFAGVIAYFHKAP